MYLEGDAVATLELLADAIRASGVDAAAVEKRKTHWAAEHTRLWDADRAAEAEVAANPQIQPLTLAAALGEALPENSFYVDETITHRGILLRHLKNRGPQSYFRPQGGLGQGIGIALGVKLAARDRPVVLVVGDGSFMYNPVIQALALSHHQDLPILIVISNNDGYLAMKKEHHAFYPDGVSAANDLFYGEPVTDLDYAEIAKLFGGFGRRVDDPAELPAVLKEAQAAVEGAGSAG